MQLQAEKIITIQVQCSETLPVGEDGNGNLRVIPIIGGRFDGKFSGEVVNGGADWNTEKQTGYSHVFAKYLLKTDDGHYIAIENEGKIDFSVARDIRTTPRFQVSQDGPYAWLNHGVYVGGLQGGKTPMSVEITIYQLA